MIEQILVLFLIHTVRFHPMDFSKLAQVFPQKIFSILLQIPSQEIYATKQKGAFKQPLQSATMSKQTKGKGNSQRKESPKYSGSSTIIHLKYFDIFKRVCPDQMHVLPAVCYSENRSEDPKSIGPGGIGICQINKIQQWRAGSGSLLDPETNIRVACEIIHEQGGNPWTDFRNGNWLRFTIAR